MSHKKCLISEVFLESIYGIPLFLFCIVHISCLCTKFWIWMSKVSHLNFSLNTHFFVKTISSANPYFLMHHFNCCLTGNAFSTSNYPMCHIFLDSFLSIHFLVWTISFSNPFFFLRQFNHCLTGNAFYHIQHIITNTICQRLPTQQHKKTSPPMVRQCLHPAAPLLPATSPTSCSLLPACRHMLVLAIAAQRAVSHPALISAPPTVRTK